MANTVRHFAMMLHTTLTRLAIPYHCLKWIEGEFNKQHSDHLSAKDDAIATFCCLVWGMPRWRLGLDLARARGLPRPKGSILANALVVKSLTEMNPERMLQIKAAEDTSAWLVTADRLMLEAVQEVAVVDAERAELLDVCLN